jgi:hypothetical protein
VSDSAGVVLRDIRVFQRGAPAGAIRSDWIPITAPIIVATVARLTPLNKNERKIIRAIAAKCESIFP